MLPVPAETTADGRVKGQYILASATVTSNAPKPADAAPAAKPDAAAPITTAPAAPKAEAPKADAKPAATVNKAA